MSVKHYITTKDFLHYGSIFENINKNEILKTELAEYGYDEVELAKGKALYDAAAQKIDANKTETTEEKLAYDKFSQKFEELKKNYATDRKKTKIIYKEDERILSALGVKGVASLRINQILDNADTLYKQLKTNEDLRKPLERLKINEGYLDTQIALLEEVKTLYQAYIKEKGESQQATKDKDQALANLEKWIREFYAIAKIALEDKPQLLESVSKFVKS